MAALDMHKSPRCQHVHYSGKPCKAPARRGRNYCVFHQAAHLDPGGCVLPVVEDLHSYQVAVIRIMQSLAAGAIDSKKATALLYALQLLGGKLNDFVKQRAEIENPAVALKKDIEARYDARHNSLPSWIPEKELVAILKEIATEESVEPNDHIEIFPQAAECSTGVPPVTPPVAAGRSTGVPPVTPPVAAGRSTGVPPVTLPIAADRNIGVPPVTPAVAADGAEVAERLTKNNPALQRRDSAPQNRPSAVGTTETSSADSAVPAGLVNHSGAPGAEAPGYSQLVPPGRVRREHTVIGPLSDLRPPQDDARPPAAGAA